MVSKFTPVSVIVPLSVCQHSWLAVAWLLSRVSSVSAVGDWASVLGSGFHVNTLSSPVSGDKNIKPSNNKRKILHLCY